MYVWQKPSKCLGGGGGGWCVWGMVFDTKEVSREAALLGVTIKDGLLICFWEVRKVENLHCVI